MFSRKHRALVAAFTLTSLWSLPASGQDVAFDPLADGQLTDEELGVVVASAQQQLIGLTEKATEAYQEEITDDQPNMPAAWLLMKDGKTVKRINIDGQAQGIPASGRIKMYRAAIKAVAQGGAINAAMILYTGRINEDSDTQALVIEHEHRLGVSANKVVGYEVQSGQILWGEPVTQSKPYEWFYTEKDSNS